MPSSRQGEGVRRSGRARPAGRRDLHAEGDRRQRLATGLKPLLSEDTAIVFAQNGIPWWYDIGLPQDHPPTPDLAFLDPGGRLRAAIRRSASSAA